MAECWTTACLGSGHAARNDIEEDEEILKKMKRDESIFIICPQI